jgi:hypothetical protein
MSFVLDTINAGEAARGGSGFATMRAETGYRIESDGRERFAQVGKGHFDAVGEAGDPDIQMGMFSRQVVEGLKASG